MAKLKLRRQEIAAGPLKVFIEVDASNRLHSVRLPARIPAGLRAWHLASLSRRLERHVLAVDDAPPFHRKVWQRLRHIPKGATLTYGGLAAALGNPGASRAVGQACAANPLGLIVPCHRVRAAQGLGGFAWGLEWKEKLLELESSPQSQR